MDNNITIITTSCKAYDDVLAIHEKLYEEYWPDCPFKRVLVMDEINTKADYSLRYDKFVETKLDGSKNHLRLVEGVKNTTTDYVIFVQEDMLLDCKVNNEEIFNLFSIMRKEKASVMYLCGMGGETEKDYRIPFRHYDNILLYPPDMPYRISYAPAIWEKKYFFEVSRQYENASDFERRGSAYSNRLDGIIFGSKYNAYPYINALRRGKWEAYASWFLLSKKIIPDYKRHPCRNSKEELKMSLINYIYNINPRKILKIQNTFGIGKRY